MGLLGDVLGAVGVSSAQALWDQKEKGRDREYATKMSNTAHQREVTDLKAAGLNPILSAGGGGASVPSISSTSAPDIAGSLNKIQSATSGKKIAGMQSQVLAGQARNQNAIARQNEASADYQSGANDLYNNNTKVKALVDVSRLLKDSGGLEVLSTVGSGINNVMGWIGRGNSAKVIRNTQKNKTINQYNRKLEGLTNKKTGEIGDAELDRVIKQFERNNPR